MYPKHFSATSLDIQIPPQVRCFRYVFRYFKYQTSVSVVSGMSSAFLSKGNMSSFPAGYLYVFICAFFQRNFCTYPSGSVGLFWQYWKLCFFQVPGIAWRTLLTIFLDQIRLLGLITSTSPFPPQSVTSLSRKHMI